MQAAPVAAVKVLQCNNPGQAIIFLNAQMSLVLMTNGWIISFFLPKRKNPAVAGFFMQLVSAKYVEP
jgi:hypothetical protein